MQPSRSRAGGEENGSLNAQRLSFQWQELASLGSPSDGVIESIIDQLRQQPGLGMLGPDVSLVGAGEAYERAITNRGGDVATARRDADTSLGLPFLVRNGSGKLGEFATLHQALNAVNDGDTIEIRGDGPFRSARRDDSVGKKFTIKAAPGFRTVLEGDLVLQNQDEISVEGIHFAKGAIGGSGIYPNVRIDRLVNCSFASDGEYTVVARGAEDGTTEILNCLISRAVHFGLAPDSELRISNSVVGAVVLDSVTKGEPRVALERCIIGSTCPEHHVASTSFLGDPNRQILPAFLANRSVFAISHSLLSDRPTAWQGSSNAYLNGVNPWIPNQVPPLVGLEAVGNSFKSPETASVVVDSLVYDPTQWRIVRTSHNGDVDVTRYGADVNHVATGKE